MAIFRRNPRKVPLALRPMRQSTHENRPPGSLRGDEPANQGDAERRPG